MTVSQSALCRLNKAAAESLKLTGVEAFQDTN